MEEIWGLSLKSHFWVSGSEQGPSWGKGRKGGTLYNGEGHGAFLSESFQGLKEVRCQDYAVPNKPARERIVRRSRI